MKKIFSFFAAMLFAGSMMAEPITLTFRDYESTSGDGGTPLTTATLIDSLDNAAGFVTCSATSKAYPGRVGYGCKLGSSSAVGSFTLELVNPAEFDSIAIYCSSYSKTEGKLSINNGEEIDLTDGEESNKILRNVMLYPQGEFTTLSVKTTAARAYVKSITFYPKEVAAPEADARVYAYGLNVTEDGDNYSFAYTCNVNAVAGKLVFYNAATQAKEGFVALTDVTAGSHNITVAKADLPADGNLNWSIELEGGNITAFKNVHTGAARTGRGQLVVNTVPESDFFGNIYYTNRTGNTSGGLYVYGPDYQQIGGLSTLGETAVWGSQKLSIDAKGNLWLPDWTDGHSGVYFVDPSNLNTCSQVFQGTRATSGLFQNNGEDVGGSCVVAHIYGEGENTKLMTIDEDMTGYAHSLMIYNIGEEHTWATAPSQKILISENAGQVFSLAAMENGVWLCQSRAKGSNTSGARSLMFYDYNGTRKYVSNDATFINGSMGGGITLDKEGKIYMPDAEGNILILTPTYGADAVTLTKETVACGFTMISSMFFDYAGNLVITGSNSGSYNNSASFQIAVFALPTTENVCETPAKKALVVSKPAAPTINYWLVGPAAENGWDQTKAMPMAGDSIVRHLAAGTYEFKVLTQEGSWTGALGFANLNAEASSANVFGSDNVVFELENEGDVTIKVVEGQIVVLGTFKEQVVADYYIKFAGNNWVWVPMTQAPSGVYMYEGVWGGTGANVNDKQDNNGATWFPEADIFFGTLEMEPLPVPAVGTVGYYAYIPDAEPTPMLAFLYEGTPTGLNNAEAEVKAVKFLENGRILIRKGDAVYTVTGLRIR